MPRSILIISGKTIVVVGIGSLMNQPSSASDLKGQGVRIFAIVMAATMATGPAMAWSLFGPSDEEIYLSACEEILKDRLKSPSSYKLISVVGPEVRPATKDEYFGWNIPEIRAEDQKLFDRDPAFREAIRRRAKFFEEVDLLYVEGFIRYEAANGFGGSIQGAAKCSYTTASPAEEALSRASPVDIKIDGYSKLDWALKAIRQMSN